MPAGDVAGWGLGTVGAGEAAGEGNAATGVRGTCATRTGWAGSGTAGLAMSDAAGGLPAAGTVATAAVRGIGGKGLTAGGATTVIGAVMAGGSTATAGPGRRQASAVGLGGLSIGPIGRRDGGGVHCGCPGVAGPRSSEIITSPEGSAPITVSPLAARYDGTGVPGQPAGRVA